jgi:3-oxoadipate enol-lactonase
MKTVQLRGDEFRVLDIGAGPPVLLVHGFPLDHTMWQGQINLLADRYRVIAPDLRCFGESVAGAGTVTMEQMADDVAALLDALEITEPVVYCGLSMGGYVAWQFQRKYPAKLRALILCDTRSQDDSAEAVQSRQKMIDHVLRAGTQYVAEAMLPRLFAKDSFQRVPAEVEGVRQKILACRAESVVAAIRGLMVRPDVSGQLGSIRVPTLAIVGEHDLLSPPAEMQAMAAAIPGARCVVIPDSGHMTPLENPAAFNAELERFLRTLEPSTS